MRRSRVPKYISLKVSEDLYDLIARDADDEDMPMNEFVVHVLAAHFKRDDLDYVPRMRRGRPRKNGKEFAKAR